MSIKKQVFVSEIKSIDEKEMTLTAAISTDTVDRMGEVLDPRGIDIKNYTKNPVVLFAHDYSQPPIGKAMWVRRDGQMIISKVKFASTAFAQEIFQLYKEGIMKAFSVGFVPKDYVEGDGKKSPRLTYTKWELLEYSAVPVPANPDAIALALQKGIVLSDQIKSAFEIKEELPGEEIKDIEVEAKNDGLDELMAENAQLKEQISNLEKESSDLRFKLFDVLNQLNQKTKKLSEISDDAFVSKAHEIIVGEIRKAQGKVN